jgi:uncharacterized protein YacL
MNDRQIEVLNKRYNVIYDPDRDQFIRTSEGLRTQYLYEMASAVIFFGIFTALMLAILLFSIGTRQVVLSYLSLMMMLALLALTLIGFHNFSEFYRDERSMMTVLAQLWQMAKLKEKEVKA